jgi:hypothetical protein
MTGLRGAAGVADVWVVYEYLDGEPYAAIRTRETREQARDAQASAQLTGGDSFRVVREPLGWWNAQAADGPAVSAWLKTNYPAVMQSEASARRLNDWDKGVRASLPVLDRILTRLGLRLGDVPDDMWVVGSAFTEDPGREPRAKKHKGARESKLCRECGGAIPDRDPSGKRRSDAKWAVVVYCSRECSLRAKGRDFREANVVKARWEPRHCMACSGEIAQYHSTGRRKNHSDFLRTKFCSHACRRGSTHLRKPVDMKRCEFCGNEMERKTQGNGEPERPYAYRNRRFCGRSCATRALNERRRGES